MIYLHSGRDDAHSRCFTLSDHLFVQGECVRGRVSVCVRAEGVGGRLGREGYN